MVRVFTSWFGVVVLQVFRFAFLVGFWVCCVNAWFTFGWLVCFWFYYLVWYGGICLLLGVVLIGSIWVWVYLVVATGTEGCVVAGFGFGLVALVVWVLTFISGCSVVLVGCVLMA